MARQTRNDERRSDFLKSDWVDHCELILVSENLALLSHAMTFVNPKYCMK